MSEQITGDELEREAGFQFERIEALITFIVRSELGPVYQSNLDLADLRAKESDLLNDDAKKLTDLLRENERDAAAQKYFGVPSYAMLTPDQRLRYAALYGPIADSQTEQLQQNVVIRIQDRLTLSVMHGEPTVTDVELYTFGIQFIDRPSGTQYSVEWGNNKINMLTTRQKDTTGSLIYTKIRDPLAKMEALQRTHWLLNHIEDQALTMIYPEAYPPQATTS